MSTMVPMYGFGGGGGSGMSGATLSVSAPAGATVTVTKDGVTKTKVAGSDGVVVFKGLETGVWTITGTDGTKTDQKTVRITKDYEVAIFSSKIPDFVYTGDYEIVNDSDEPITASQDNWKIRFLTSGTLTFSELKGASDGIDVFIVGGGGAGGTYGSGKGYGGGGGGGYTKTVCVSGLETGKNYSIVVGAGGTVRGNGGVSTAFGNRASGGTASGVGTAGGDGGSGGGGGGLSSGGAGGIDGSNGKAGTGSSARAGGAGQGTTTREFGESNGNLYSYGGKGAIKTEIAVAVDNNTGNGGNGNGANSTSCPGGSGIVIIRNARGVA